MPGAGETAQGQRQNPPAGETGVGSGLTPQRRGWRRYIQAILEQSRGLVQPMAVSSWQDRGHSKAKGVLGRAGSSLWSPQSCQALLHLFVDRDMPNFKNHVQCWPRDAVTRIKSDSAWRQRSCLTSYQEAAWR